jgi:hypothetical protein
VHPRDERAGSTEPQESMANPGESSIAPEALAGSEGGPGVAVDRTPALRHRPGGQRGRVGRRVW